MLVRYENKPSIPNLWEDFFGPGFMGDVYRKSRVSRLPSANIIEEKDNYFIELAAPGFEKADFKIKLSENVLTVSVEKEENIENTTQREFSYTSFSRGFNIPETIQVEKIKAEYENGILQIALPKKEEAIVKPLREIEIS